MPITLQNDTLRCILRPDMGGAIQSLAFRSGRGDDIPVLRTYPVIHTVRDLGCFPLVPFSNRVARAQLQWQGTNHPLITMGSAEEHAIHGVAWQKPWQVLEATDDFAMLSYEHAADKTWPFAFDVSQTFKLTGSALQMTLSITNQAQSSAPVGLGWHPYFAKRSQSHIAFAATGRWEMGSDNLPTQLNLSRGLDADCEQLESDHCFEGWGGRVDLTDERLQTTIESTMPRLIVYTHPSKDFVAIEPVSHASNAVNHADPQSLGVRTLQSGESYSAQMTISLARRHSQE